MERQILETVARADMFVCSALRVMAIVAVLCVVLVAMVLIGRKIEDPDRQNYYGPCDITSEGPDDGGMYDAGPNSNF